MDIRSLLRITEKRQASDLHLVVGYQATIRVDGELVVVPGSFELTAASIEEIIFSVINEKQKELFLTNKELDFSLSSTNAHYRVNLYYQRGSPAAAFRLIPQKIRTIKELNLPDKLHVFSKLKQGLVLITAPTGHGKSTTQAALINEINRTRPVHLVTIEDPVEYIFPKAKAIVSQREMNTDTHAWKLALRAVLREDPDVVLIGEMRDLETIQSVITIAETGHLVFATLHTNSAAQSVERIIDVFPEGQQDQIRIQLAAILEGVISQRLVPAMGGGRVPAVELLFSNPAIKNAIREEKTHQIDNIIQTSGDAGMNLLEKSLAELVTAGMVDIRVAQEWSMRPGELARQMKNKK
jgi:twitching motility protein PilT